MSKTTTNENQHCCGPSLQEQIDYVREQKQEAMAWLRQYKLWKQKKKQGKKIVSKGIERAYAQYTRAYEMYKAIEENLLAVRIAMLAELREIGKEEVHG